MSPFPLLRWAFNRGEIAMWTSATRPQFLDQQRFELRGDGVLQSFRFIMSPVPRHAKNLGQHTLDQVVAHGETLSNSSARDAQPDPSVLAHLDHAIAL